MHYMLNTVADTWHWMINNIFYINLLFSIIIIFFQRRDTKAVWAWLLLLTYVPIVGFVLYLIIGQNLHKTNMFRVKEVEDKINAAIRKQEDSIYNNEFDNHFHITDERLSDYKDLVLYNLEVCRSRYTENNEIRIFTDGDAKFLAVKEAIKKARKNIHIQYYIISDGELFHEILELLEKKVSEGVEVRVLYDSLGSIKIGKKNVRRMKAAGIKVGEFFPALFGILQLRLNYRNHRKIVVVDGETAFVGGFNIGDEYVDGDVKMGHWRDTHFEIKGEGARELQMRFMLDWDYATKENLFHNDSDIYLKNSAIKCKNKIGMQIVTSGPDSIRQEIRDNYLKLINKAKERIYIQTPYFIPDEAVLQSLKLAALSGVDVRLMIPCKPDHVFVYWITYSYAGDLLESGAKCYCYEDGFLHSKGIIVDGVVSSYGTANMDIRSFELNFEVNAVIYSPEISMQLEKIFLEDMTKCTEITRYDYAKRGMRIRFKEQVSRLLTPLM